MDEEDLGAVSALLADFSTRINDIEEKTRLLTEKLFTISQTILRQNDRSNKEIIIIKEDITNIKNDIDRLKETIEQVVSESSEFARREELKVLERYMKIFEPLKFATIDDVKRIVKKALKEKKEGIIRVEE